MFKFHYIFSPLIMSAVLSQTAVASDRDYTEEIAACAPVGEIAKKISKLQDLGFQREFVETKLNHELAEGLSIWVAPLSRLVFSRQEKSPEKIIKQAIGYCLDTMKTHKKRTATRYVDA